MNNKIKTMVLAVGMVSGLLSFADQNSITEMCAVTEPRVFEQGNEKLWYRWQAPAIKNSTSNKRYPLVILLHGAGERGSDNRAQLMHGAKEIINYATKTNQEIFFIAPQVPLNEQWVDTPWDATAHTISEKPSRSMGLLLALIDYVRKAYPVDDKRIYITGLSMGGYGTWDALARRPDLFAAAIPICGGGDVNTASQIKNIPIWCFHGAVDSVVPTVRSRTMVDALKAVKGKIQYCEYPGVDHGSWFPTYKNEKVLAWFFEQHR